MERSLVHLLVAATCFGLWLSSGCDGSSPEGVPREAELQARRAEFYRERAADMAAERARRVRLIAEDMAKLNPRSERSAASREAKKQLEELVPRETKEPRP